MRNTGFNKIIILGAGAIGSVCGALLSEHNNVLLVGRKPHVNRINSEGLSVSNSTSRNFRVKATTEIVEIPDETLIVLTTKAHDSAKTVERIKELIRKDTVILVLQNGLGNEESVKQVIDGKCKVLRAITTMAAEFLKPGLVRFWEGETIIERTGDGEKISDVFNRSKLRTRLSDDIEAEIWNKLVVNCAVNPLTAIFRVRNNEIVTESLKPLRQLIVNECVAVGNAEGRTFPLEMEKRVDEEIRDYTNFSSMAQDALKGKKTEIDFLNGKIVELGRKHHIPTPVNETLVCMIKRMEEMHGFSGEDQRKEG